VFAALLFSPSFAIQSADAPEPGVVFRRWRVVSTEERMRKAGKAREHFSGGGISREPVAGRRTTQRWIPAGKCSGGDADGLRWKTSKCVYALDGCRRNGVKQIAGLIARGCVLEKTGEQGARGEPLAGRLGRRRLWVPKEAEIVVKVGKT